MSKNYLKDGNFNKFIVIKNEDIDKYSTYTDLNDMDRILRNVRIGRLKEDKKANTYLVINTDESYAPEIVEILKTNGHWD